MTTKTEVASKRRLKFLIKQAEMAIKIMEKGPEMMQAHAVVLLDSVTRLYRFPTRLFSVKDLKSTTKILKHFHRIEQSVVRDAMHTTTCNIERAYSYGGSLLKDKITNYSDVLFFGEDLVQAATLLPWGTTSQQLSIQHALRDCRELIDSNGEFFSQLAQREEDLVMYEFIEECSRDPEMDALLLSFKNTLVASDRAKQIAADVLKAFKPSKKGECG